MAKVNKRTREKLKDGRTVYRNFYAGVLGEEWFADKDGQRHGLWRTWHGAGKPCEVSFYVHGKQHGEQLQYETDGNLIGRCLFEYGTGIDLWLHRAGILAEEREYVDGILHGYMRWWTHDETGHNEKVYDESHYRHGTQHGIFRRWNENDKLSRGYPQYYVNGERVTKRQYERACRTDPTLPPFRAEDNLPQRPLPEAMLKMMNELV